MYMIWLYVHLNKITLLPIKYGLSRWALSNQQCRRLSVTPRNIPCRSSMITPCTKSNLGCKASTEGPLTPHTWYTFIKNRKRKIQKWSLTKEQGVWIECVLIVKFYVLHEFSGPLPFPISIVCAHVTHTQACVVVARAALSIRDVCVLLIAVASSVQ